MANITAKDLHDLIFNDGRLYGDDGANHLCNYTDEQRIQLIEEYAQSKLTTKQERMNKEELRKEFKEETGEKLPKGSSYLMWLESKLTTKQESVTDEEIEKKINFLNSKDLPTVWKLKELSKWMQDNLQAQTNDGELYEYCKNEEPFVLMRFRNHQNTNKDG